MFLNIGAPNNEQNRWEIPVNEFILMKIAFRTFAAIVKKITPFAVFLKEFCFPVCISWILRILEEQISQGRFQ